MKSKNKSLKLSILFVFGAIIVSGVAPGLAASATYTGFDHDQIMGIMSLSMTIEVRVHYERVSIRPWLTLIEATGVSYKWSTSWTGDTDCLGVGFVNLDIKLFAGSSQFLHLLVLDYRSSVDWITHNDPADFPTSGESIRTEASGSASAIIGSQPMCTVMIVYPSTGGLIS